MTLFNFGDEKTTRVDEHASDPGAQSTGAPSPVASATSDAARREALAEAARSPRRRRANAGGNDRPSADNSAALQAKVNAAIAAQLEQLHKPKQWEMLLALPAAAARAWTGDKELWTLDKEEKEVLGETGAACAQTLMITNPRALAVTMLSAVLLTVYGPRAIAQMEKLREAREKKKNETVGKA